MNTFLRLFFITLITFFSNSPIMHAMQQNKKENVAQHVLGLIKNSFEQRNKNSGDRKEVFKKITGKNSIEIVKMTFEMNALKKEIDDLAKKDINKENKKEALKILSKFFKIIISIASFYGTDFVIQLLEYLDFFEIGWIAKMIIKIPVSILITLTINKTISKSTVWCKNFISDFRRAYAISLAIAARG